MRFNRTHLVLLTVAAATLSLLLLYFRNQPEPKKEGTMQSRKPMATASPTPQPTPSASQAEHQNASKGGGLKDPEKVRRSAESFNAPISFWGKVVDQDGKSLDAVTVKYNVRHMALPTSGFPDYRSDFHELTTGADGTFSITGMKGDSLGIDALKKQGYQMGSRDQRSFAYAQAPTIFTPDVERPVVFTMIKAEEGVRLKRFTGRFELPYNGTPVSFDPITGRRGIGKIRISCLRVPPSGPAPTQNYPWTLTLQVEGGGIMPIEPGAVYEAPEKGYEARSTFEMKPGIAWKAGVQQEYYFKMPDNLYGRLTVVLSLRNDEPNAFVKLSGVINPSGSRNLELSDTSQTTTLP